MTPSTRSLRPGRLGRRARGLALVPCLTLALAAGLAAPQATAQTNRPRPKPARPSAPPATAPDATASGAGTIPVTVVEVAGSEAYLQPGASGGVHRGAKVLVNRAEYTVVATSAAYALVDVTRAPLHEQDRGVASIVAEEEEKPRELAKPRPLTTWTASWTEASSPAAEQAPRFVPLGGAERDRRWDVRLTVAAGTIQPLGRGPATELGEINARIHAEPFQRPIAFDLDASLQRWAASDLSGRAGGDARPLLWVRELMVGYGTGGGAYAGLGRMRYAASTLGTLDGGRVRAPLGSGFAVGAFGGTLPNPLSSEPSLSAQRFGVEATFHRPDLDLRPEAALVAQASTFGGSLDERRLSGLFGIYPGLARFGGHFELSGFDPHNEWKASPIELTGAGLDGSVHVGPIQLGARVDLEQPERSRWLSSYLPTWWFCRTVPLVPSVSSSALEPCDGSVSTRALGAVDAGIEVGHVAVTVGGTTINDLSQSGGAPDMRGAFASGRVVRIANVARVEASGNYSTGTFLKMFGGSAGPGVSLFQDSLDVSAYYRYTSLEYRSVSTSLVQHGFGGMVMFFPSASLLFTLQGEAITGEDIPALLLFGTAMWRPRL